MPTALKRIMRIVPIEPREAAAVAWAIAWFFALLSANYLLRPVREAIGVEKGVGQVRWLFVGTAAVMLAANPLFGALVARVRRHTLVAATYRFFALNLVAFWILRVQFPDAVGVASGRVFYVWLSVFNLFAVSLFWAFMADSFALEQSKRLYGLICVGGTAGAIAGAAAAESLAIRVGAPVILLVAALLLEVAVQCARRVDRTAPPRADAPADDRAAAIGGSAIQGAVTVARDAYLRGIGLYLGLFAILGTLMYFMKLRIVAGASADTDVRTAIFAGIDKWSQAATLFAQLVLTSRVLRSVGIGTSLAALPVAFGAGFAALAAAPTQVVMTAVESVTKVVRYAFATPARETLYTIVTRDAKYKAKAFIDTFGFRLGDVIGAYADFGLARLAAAIGAASVTLASAGALPVVIVWGGLGLWLGREQRRRAAAVTRRDDAG
jgi:AAA family ATP:ADP antiporter